MEDKDAKVDIGGLEEYSGNIKKYGNGLSLGNVDGYSDKVRVFMQALKVKLTSLKTYIETYSDHITTHMEDLLEIERTIGENFDNSLCGSAFVTDFLTRSNYGVAVGNDQKYCFNGSFDSICIVLAINKIISNAAKEDCTNIFDGVDEVLFSEDLKNDIENLYNNDKANFKNNIYKAFDEENLSGITSIINNVLDIRHDSSDLAKKAGDILEIEDFIETDVRKQLKEEGYTPDEINAIFKFREEFASDADTMERGDYIAVGKKFFDEIKQPEPQQPKPQQPEPQQSEPQQPEPQQPEPQQPELQQPKPQQPEPQQPEPQQPEPQQPEPQQPEPQQPEPQQSESQQPEPQQSEPQQPDNSSIYVVKANDNLYKVFGGDWEAVWKANYDKLGNNPSLIQPGMELVIPEGVNYNK